jgi:hypothetical protein
MGNCSVFHDEMRFDVRNPEFTTVYVLLRCEGDCPHMVHGWHRKDFAKEIPMDELFNRIWTGHETPMTWERGNPQPVNAPVLFHPHQFAPVQIEQLQAWRDALTFGDGSTGLELADQINAILSAVPDWNKACPFCRLHEEMLRAQMNPQA